MKMKKFWHRPGGGVVPRSETAKENIPTPKSNNTGVIFKNIVITDCIRSTREVGKSIPSMF